MSRLPVALLCMFAIACKTGTVKAEEAKVTPRAGAAADATPAAGKTLPAQQPAKTPAVGKTQPAQPVQPLVIPVKHPRVTRPFLNLYESTAFFAHMDEEHQRFGTAPRVKKYKKKKYGNSSVEQRSGRKRLYDHNIFLRSLFAGELAIEPFGNLQPQFQDGIFLDIGSAILFDEGANTVRDLYEDEKIQRNLLIVASDINDKANKKTMYIDQYRRSGKKLPFPVVEVPLLMVKPEHFINPIKLFLPAHTGGLIFRSANAGPDLYYNREQVHAHLCALISAFPDKNILYLFNKFILYKPENRLDFIILGEIDETVGINHRETVWEDIDWSKRTLKEAIRENHQHLLLN